MALVLNGKTRPANQDLGYANSTRIERIVAKGAEVWLLQKYYYVRFLANSGSGSMSDQTMPVGAAARLAANAFVRLGYLFTGWSRSAADSKAYDNEQTVTDIAAAGETLLLYALWNAITYYVDYYANGGNGGMERSAFRYDMEAPLRAVGFSRTGYNFQGWATSSTGSAVYGNQAAVRNWSSEHGQVIHLYAVWNAITYYIDFNGNGATGGATPRAAYTYDVTGTVPGCGFIRSGYSFVNWFTDIGDQRFYYNAGAALLNRFEVHGAIGTFYASWVRNAITCVDDNDSSKKSLQNTSVWVDCTDFHYLKLKVRGQVTDMWKPSTSCDVQISCGIQNSGATRAVMREYWMEEQSYYGIQYDTTPPWLVKDPHNWVEIILDVSGLTGNQELKAWITTGPGGEAWWLDAKNVILYN